MRTNDFVDDPQRQCVGKFGYSSKKHAKRVIRRLTSRTKELHAYRCPHCERFHIGGKR